MSWITNWLSFFGGKTTDTNGVHYSGAATVFDSGYVTSKGPNTFDEAASVASVFKCYRIIGETFGSFQAGYYKKDDKGNSIPYTEHPLYNLYNSEPNPLYSAMTYWETACMHVAYGNHYSYHNTDQNGKTISFDLLNPEQIQMFVWDNKIWYRDIQTQTTYSQDEIIHVKGPSKDGLIGMNPLRYAATSFNAAKSSGQYVDSVYENGAFIGGALLTDKELDDDAQARLSKSWADAYGGSKKAGGTAVLEQGVKFQEIRMKPQDLDIIQTRQYQDSDISGLFRVPLHLINALERSTNNNIEQQDIDFAKHCMRIYAKRFESEYNRKTVPKDKIGKEFLRFNMDSLLRGDTKSRAEYYKTRYFINSITPNEIRRLEKETTIEGGDELYFETMAKMGSDNKNIGENGTQNKERSKQNGQYQLNGQLN